MEVNGLPLHVLVVHAVVVIAPLAALAGLTYAVRPAWRWLLRWPLVVLAVSAAGLAFLAKQSGEAMLEDRPFLLEAEALRDKILLHQDRGELLVWFALGFLVVSLFAAWAAGGPSALVSGRGALETRGALGTGTVVLLAVAAVALLVMTVLTGDAGAQAVWGE
jgi:hypothetical protein